MTEIPDKELITQILNNWQQGDKKALHQLMPLVHDNLQGLANQYMRSEQAGHTLQATALVNEAYIKLCDKDVSWQNRAHFLALAARTMRQILVDHAKSKRRQKRGGANLKVTLNEFLIADNGQQPDVLDVEEALEKLAQQDSRKAQIIELNFYGGLTYDEIAEVLGISAATVDRDLRFARAWLQNKLTQSI